ncbi:substrate-binding domain-containing protein [Kribbella sp. NPDC026596]|uniref:substrate-binding domain-containing protein n=1 Tax=Kribbella sp. NPDC026596 TaxID=3155122 RepID=UPI0034088E4E
MRSWKNVPLTSAAGSSETASQAGVSAPWATVSGAAYPLIFVLTHPGLTAVFAASDLLASGALVELRRAGRRVPEEVAVGGFDDSRIARESDPPLTTIRQPLELVAREMIEVLLHRIEGDDVAPRILPTELVVRASG